MLFKLLKDYVPFDRDESIVQKQIQSFLEDSQNPYDRSNLVVHIVRMPGF